MAMSQDAYGSQLQSDQRLKGRLREQFPFLQSRRGEGWSGGAHTQAKGPLAAIALMQSDRDRCDISVPTHFHTTSHRLGVTHIPLLWSCPPAAGQHDDARMNLAIALTAARYGAAIANYTEVVHLLKRADPQTGKQRVCAAHCRDGITGQEFDVRAKCVINATGPFTDALRKMDDQKSPNICQLGAGVHIVTPGFLQRCHLISSLASAGIVSSASGHNNQALSGSSVGMDDSEQVLSRDERHSGGECHGIRDLSASPIAVKDVEYDSEMVVGDVSQSFSTSSLRLHLASGGVATDGSLTCGVCLGETLVKVL
ncbi:Glycerol-3-phosphate dehydrogenase, mitochondrial [Liparis tanakae]|uniref:glycerol-3-phosphate dehydrogenase n=1 Tax=Liparis tanakae TaxID=230148 RepID=A0A4Z2J4V2_9TELE|nr:Glycerol-3-phosphate dehydrogenase, mitochondrial [Liparis tanakae]